MATNDHGTEDYDQLETPFDATIRTALRGEVRPNSNANHAWTRILQRAQTEVSQLPPLADDKADNRTDALVETNRTALPESYLLVRRAPDDAFDLFRPDFGQQIRYYRRLMDMKMWYSVGALGLLSGTL